MTVNLYYFYFIDSIWCKWPQNSKVRNKFSKYEADIDQIQIGIAYWSKIFFGEYLCYHLSLSMLFLRTRGQTNIVVDYAYKNALCVPV